MPIRGTLVKTTNRQEFTQDYKMKIFVLWYNLGKPSAEGLHSKIVAENISDGFSGEIPTKATIIKWINKDFETKATFLDNEAAKAIEKQLISDKIEILREHAKIGKKLHIMGMEFLEKEGLTNSRIALSAVVEGLRIEMENSGTPIRFAELSKMSDEQLFAELDKYLKTTTLDRVEPNQLEDD